MCRVLLVRRSGYYAWQGRRLSARTQANKQLVERMRALHQQTREAYGARQMWHVLKRDGLSCGRHRGARLRRENGIVVSCLQRLQQALGYRAPEEFETRRGLS